MAVMAAAKAVERIAEPKLIADAVPRPIRVDHKQELSEAKKAREKASVEKKAEMERAKRKLEEEKVEAQSKALVIEAAVKEAKGVVDKKAVESERKLWRKQLQDERDQRRKDMMKKSRKGWKKKNDIQVEFIGVAKGMEDLEKKREGGVNNTVLEEDNQ